MKQDSIANNSQLAVKQPDPFAALAQYQADRFNVVLPVTQMPELPCGAKLSVRVVNVNTDIKGGDVYSVDGGKLALTGATLDKIAAAAGITWVQCERLDDRRHPHYCEFAVTARVVDFDGSVREARGVRAIDLRDDAGNGGPGPDLDEIQSSARNAERPRDPTKQTMMARKFIVPMCEAKAKNRAIRRLLSMKGAYAAAELQKPFVVPQLVPDTTNPMAQQMVLAQMTGAASLLYGPRPMRALNAAPVVEASFDEDNEPDLATAGQAGQAGGGTPPPPPAAAAPVLSPQVADRIDVPARFTKAFRTAVDIGGADVTEFAALCERACGKRRRADMTAEDVIKIESALEQWLTGGVQ